MSTRRTATSLLRRLASTSASPSSPAAAAEAAPARSSRLPRRAAVELTDAAAVRVAELLALRNKVSGAGIVVACVCRGERGGKGEGTVVCA